MARKPRPPYTSVGDLNTFFSKIANLGDPGTIDNKWVESYKLSTAQPRAIVTLLQWLGVIDEQHKSTGVWNELRVPATRPNKLAELVKSSYKEIFDRINVAQAEREDLKGTFIQAYDSGNPTRPVACFVALCEHAGISIASGATARTVPQANPDRGSSRGRSENAKQGRTRTSQRERGASDRPPEIAITLNLEIPADWSEERIRDRYEAVRRVTRGDSDDAT